MVPRTIRARITALAMLLSAALLVAVAVITVAVFRAQLTDNLDEGLAQRADTIAGALSSAPPSLPPGDEDQLVQLIDPAGHVVLASSGLAGVPPIAPLQPGLRTVDSVTGRSETFRVLTRPISTSLGERVLVVGVNNDDVTDPVAVVTRLLGVAVPCTVILLGVLTWWLIGRTLRPVETMRAEMAEISGSNLGRRVHAPDRGDEIARLARTMNATLDRLEDAVRRQQRFVADASHELRGPLTRIRTELEVALARPGDVDPAVTERSVLDETIGFQQLVDDLLQLARSDAGAAELTPAPVDVDDIVLREARRLADRGHVRIDTRAVSGAHVIGDADALHRAIRNVFDNAERHATSTVTVALEEAGGTARLTISDDGAGISAQQREHIFERFTRLDEARTRDAGGSGLGLAISRDIVQRHGGSIRLDEGATTRFVVELPARP